MSVEFRERVGIEDRDELFFEVVFPALVTIRV